MIQKKEFIASMAVILCVIASIWGNYRIADTHILGIVPTFYRIIIPAIFIICLVKHERKRECNIFHSERRPEAIFYTIAIIWVLYGIVSIVLFPSTDISTGGKELLAIILGSLVVYIISLAIYKDKFDLVIISIKIGVAVTIVLGIYELITGYHMPSTRYADKDFIVWCAEQYQWEQPYNQYLHKATGIFYNENDFCAFLAIFTPAFLYNTKYEKKRFTKVLNYLSIFAVIVIVLKDDGFICVVSLVIGLVMFLVINKAKRYEWIVITALFVIARLISTVKIEGTLTSQISTTINGSQTNSLSLRLNTYIESVKEVFLTSKGLGFGAGSFEKYFAPVAEAKNMMSNPHCLWTEILFEYGFIVFLMFVVFLVYMLCTILKKNKGCNSKSYGLVAAMGCAFAIACVAPSNYIQASYYWIVIGLGVGLINKENIDKKTYE